MLQEDDDAPRSSDRAAPSEDSGGEKAIAMRETVNLVHVELGFNFVVGKWLSPTAIPAGAIGFGASLVDVDGAATEIGAVQTGDGPVGFLRIAHFHEGKTTRAAGLAVRHQTDALHGAERFKCAANCFFRGAKIQVSYENFLHKSILELAKSFDDKLCEGKLPCGQAWAGRSN